MILDSGAEGHSGYWIVWSLGRQDENSVCVRGSSLFALKRHDTFDDGAKWILQVDEQRTQWESITSCCRILIGLETSKIVAITLELQFGSRILLKALGNPVYASFWKRSMQSFSWKICVVQGERSNSEFRETKLE